MGEEIIIQDENGKKYSILRVLDADTKKIIDDLSALVVKKDKIINEILKTWKQDDVRSIAELKKYFEERCK